MRNHSVFFRAATLMFLIFFLFGCSGFMKVKRNLMTRELIKKMSDERLISLKNNSPFLKAHIKDGKVYVLRHWTFDSTRNHVFGSGLLYGLNREFLREGTFEISTDSVALFETNRLVQSGSGVGLTVMTGITAGMTAFCIANPKACFGSCPTFYVLSGDSMRLQAEGFSSSILPSREATDIDALPHVSPSDNEIMIEMRNEALETHVVRFVNLLITPKKKGHQVFADLEGRFWESPSQISPISARSPEGDCLDPLLELDGNERYGKADSAYLGAKEIIELDFGNIPQKTYGLVIGSRQTLLSTYLLYQTFAYMGNSVGYWLAQMERNQIKSDQNSIMKLMGGIEILTQDDSGEWSVRAQVNEYGPIATDIHLAPLKNFPGKSGKIRLRMTKGNWRIDYVALAELTNPVEPVRLKPFKVLKNDVSDSRALAAFGDSAKAVTTLPGDIYTFYYQIPKTADEYEFFLESRGYYLEWIRKEWIREENPEFLAQIFFDPKQALKRLAPEFKRIESKMETYFWRSRYAKP